MASQSIISLVMRQIMSLLVGDGTTYFAQQVLEANRIVSLGQGAAVGMKNQVRPNTAAGQCPRLVITCPSRRVTNRNQMKTFTNAVSAVGDVVVQKEHTFLLAFLWDTKDDRTLSNNMEEFVDGILLANPKLGLTTPKITVSGQMQGEAKVESSYDTGGSERLILRIRFPVTFEYHRADLVAMAAFAG